MTAAKLSSLACHAETAASTVEVASHVSLPTHDVASPEVTSPEVTPPFTESSSGETEIMAQVIGGKNDGGAARFLVFFRAFVTPHEAYFRLRKSFGKFIQVSTYPCRLLFHPFYSFHPLSTLPLFKQEAITSRATNLSPLTPRLTSPELSPEEVESVRRRLIDQEKDLERRRLEEEEQKVNAGFWTSRSASVLCVSGILAIAAIMMTRQWVIARNPT